MRRHHCPLCVNESVGDTFVVQNDVQVTPFSYRTTYQRYKVVDVGTDQNGYKFKVAEQIGTCGGPPTPAVEFLTNFNKWSKGDIVRVTNEEAIYLIAEGIANEIEA